MAEARVSYTQWLKRGKSTFIPTDNAKTIEKLDAGIYNLRYADGVGYYMFKKDLKLDELLELPMPEAKEVLGSIKDFWTKKDIFKKYEFVYKRGLLLYGTPGTGKTSLINLLCKHLVQEMDGVVFVLTTGSDLSLYEHMMPEIYRVIETDRPIITVIEDIDGLCEDKSNETRIINILDGIEQLENVVYIATTNYMERLSERITNRPNRFDRRIEVKSPNYDCRKMYFEHKLKEDDLEKINLHLGEIIKSVIIFNHDLDETIETLKAMKNVVYSRNYNKEGKGGIGFTKKNVVYEEDEDECADEEPVDKYNSKTVDPVYYGEITIPNGTSTIGSLKERISQLYESEASQLLSETPIKKTDTNLFEDTEK